MLIPFLATQRQSIHVKISCQAFLYRIFFTRGYHPAKLKFILLDFISIYCVEVWEVPFCFLSYVLAQLSFYLNRVAFFLSLDAELSTQRSFHQSYHF